MKHAWKKLLAAAVLPCLLAGCGALGGPESEVPSMDHLLGLTQEQRLEDYDYLVQTLGDSYLCMGVRDRDNPEDPSAAIFQAYREMIQESDSDEVFYSAVYSTLFRLGTYGHLWIVEPDMYRAYCEAYEDGGIHEAIADYEDAVFYNILAEELARRDLGLEDSDPENFDELTARMEDYLNEFEKNGLDTVSVDI